MNMICVYSTVINVMILIYGLCFFFVLFLIILGLVHACAPNAFEDPPQT